MTHISNVKVGDLVKCPDGFVRTVGPKDLKRDPFMGITLFGDSYQLGTKPVEVVDPKSLKSL